MGTPGGCLRFVLFLQLHFVVLERDTEFHEFPAASVCWWAFGVSDER